MPTSRRPRLLAVLTLVLTLAAFPLGALASHDFTDVPDSNIYHADISALAATGVTTGCGGGNFCPSAFVTREQMAAFMNRLGALSAGKTPVVNAATAEDSDTLDGLDSSAFMPSGDIVLDAMGPWDTSTADASVEHQTNHTQLISSAVQSAFFRLQLTGPASIGGQVYALKSIRLCSGGYSNASVERLWVYYSSGILAEIASPDNPPAPMLCYNLTVDTPIATDYYGVTIQAQVGFSAAGMWQPALVRTTWTPYTPPA
ncbi:MAG TPA: S-layer homology domain-containing protein [Candidatus Limnocylindria bacterium]|nr:S-layer homology domain-containing protein [Candidatus Limnocylindria bacterium]